MDNRRHYIIILDTETANTSPILEASQCMVYDVGWIVADTKGNIYKERSFLNYNIFFDYQELMQSSYYAKKIPLYLKRIDEQKTRVASLQQIQKEFWKDCQEYGIKEVVAHNAYFDLMALNGTQRYLTKSKNRYFFPYNIEIWDSLKMAKEVLYTNRKYIQYCEDNSYLTKNKKPRLTAEILYRYITGENDFIEEHTGLSDVKIEYIIFLYCWQKRAKNRCLFNKK